jgi:hypothetical protein
MKSGAFRMIAPFFFAVLPPSQQQEPLLSIRDNC